MGGGSQSITNISKSGETLVLSYSMSPMGGQSIPATLRLTPEGEAMKVEMNLAGQFSMPGMASRE